MTDIKVFAGTNIVIKSTIRGANRQLVDPLYHEVMVLTPMRDIYLTIYKPVRLDKGKYEVRFVVPKEHPPGVWTVAWTARSVDKEDIYNEIPFAVVTGIPTISLEKPVVLEMSLEVKHAKPVKITFIGTKGEIEESPRRRTRFSSFLLEHEGKRYMFEFGKDKTQKDLDKYKPDWIIISHAHPDHAFGLLNVDPKIPVAMTSETYEILSKKRDFKLAESDVKILPRLGYIGGLLIRTISVPHSKKAPASAFILHLGKKKVFYCADLAYVSKRTLRGMWLYIGDGSYFKKGNIRKVDDTLIGHAPIVQQLKWLKDVGIKQAIFTHFGKWVIGKNIRSIFMKLSREFDINVHAAFDGRTFNLSRKRLEALPGMYLVKPHAKMIWEGKKTLIVKSRKYTKYLNKLIYFMEDQKVYGILKLTAIKGPYNAQLVLHRMKQKHRITPEEWEAWWPDKKVVFLYDFTLVKKFDKPVPYEPAPGTQVWIRSIELPKVEKGGPPAAEVTPPKKTKAETKKGGRYRLDKCMTCQNSPTVEVLWANGKAHAWFCDDCFEKWKKQKNDMSDTGTNEGDINKIRKLPVGIASKKWKKGPPRTKEVKPPSGAVSVEGVESPFSRFRPSEASPPIITEAGLEAYMKEFDIDKADVSDFSNYVLLHHHAKTHAWFHRAREGKSKFTTAQIIRYHQRIVKEMLRRGFMHNVVEDLDTQPKYEVELGDLLPVGPGGGVVGEEITLDEALQIWSKPFYVKHPLAWLVGGAVIRGHTSENYDVVINYQKKIHERDHPIEFRLGRALADAGARFNGRAEFFYHGEYGGPFTDNVPLFDLLAIPCKFRNVVHMEELYNWLQVKYSLAGLKDKKAMKEAQAAKRRGIKPLEFFIPAKPAIGHLPAERYSIESLVALVPEDAFPVAVEKKYDGNRLIIMKEGDKVIIRTDTGIDVTKMLPGTVKELSTWKEPHAFTIDSDSEIWRKGEYVGREFVGTYLMSKVTPNDDGFIHNIFDILYFYDPKMSKHDSNCQIGDLHEEPYHMRRKYLDMLPFKQSTLAKPKTTTHFNKVPLIVAETAKDLEKQVKVVSKAPASEGSVVKSLASKYALSGAIYKWWKYKKTADIHAIVLKVLPTKTAGVYRYRVGLRIPSGWKVRRTLKIKEKEYMDIGKTLNIKKRIPVGSIVTVNFEELFFYKDPETGVVQLVVYVPFIMAVRKQQTVPDGADEAIAIAEKADLLRKKTESLSYSRLYAKLETIEVEDLNDFEDVQETTSTKKKLGRMFGSPVFDDHMLDALYLWKKSGYTVEKLKALQESRNYKNVVTMQNDYFEMFALKTASIGIKLPHIRLNANWFMDEAASMIVQSHLAFYPKLLKNQPYKIDIENKPPKKKGDK